jgi:hypothetical protein
MLAKTRRAATGLAIVGLLAAIVAPLKSVEVPQVCDLQNHL